MFLDKLRDQSSVYNQCQGWCVITNEFIFYLDTLRYFVSSMFIFNPVLFVLCSRLICDSLKVEICYVSSAYPRICTLFSNT